MIEIPITSYRTFYPPTTLVVEASWEAIIEHDLDWQEGEQFDRIEACLSMVVQGSEVTFTTVRSWAAWKRGEANAGRKTVTIPRSKLERVLA